MLAAAAAAAVLSVPTWRPISPPQALEAFMHSRGLHALAEYTVRRLSGSAPHARALASIAPSRASRVASSATRVDFGFPHAFPMARRDGARARVRM